MYLRISSVLLILTITTGCSLFQSKDDDAPIPDKYNGIVIQDRPRGLKLEPVNFKTVTDETIEEVIETYTQPTGDYVFIGISVEGYENLALNMNDITRYIEQLLSLVTYYENLVQKSENPTNVDNSTR